MRNGFGGFENNLSFLLLPNTHTHTIRARLRVPRAHARRRSQAVDVECVVAAQDTRARKVCKRLVRSRGRAPPHLVRHVGQEGQRVMAAASVEGPREQGFAVCEAGGACGAFIQATRSRKGGQPGGGGQAGPRHDDDRAEGGGGGEQGGEGVGFGAGRAVCGLVRGNVDTPACARTPIATHTHTHTNHPHLSRRRLRRTRRPNGSSCAIALVFAFPSSLSGGLPAAWEHARALCLTAGWCVRVRGGRVAAREAATVSFLRECFFFFNRLKTDAYFF